MGAREEAIEALYASIQGRVPLSIDRYVQCLDGWRVEPIKDGDETVGAMLTKGNEVHIGVTRIPAGARRRYARRLQEVIDRCGSAVTSVMKGNERGLAFCKRLGFTVTEERGGLIYLQCWRAKHA